MIRTPISRTRKCIIGIISVVILLVMYTILSEVQHKKNATDTTIPNWTQLSQGIKTCCTPHKRSGEIWLWEDAKATFLRLFYGVTVGVLGALFIGLMMGCFAHTEALLMPPLTLLALIPPTAALAVYFVVAGTGMSMYILMISLGIGATLARSVYESVRDVPSELLYKAYTLGASKTEIIFDVILRLILPRFINAVRLHIAPAMIFLIAAEMVVGDVGFGYRIRLQSRLMNMNIVYPYLVALAAFGFVIDWSLRQTQLYLSPWFEQGRK